MPARSIDGLKIAYSWCRWFEAVFSSISTILRSKIWIALVAQSVLTSSNDTKPLLEIGSDKMLVGTWAWLLPLHNRLGLDHVCTHFRVISVHVSPHGISAQKVWETAESCPLSTQFPCPPLTKWLFPENSRSILKMHPGYQATAESTPSRYCFDSFQSGKSNHTQIEEYTLSLLLQKFGKQSQTQQVIFWKILVFKK